MNNPHHQRRQEHQVVKFESQEAPALNDYELQIKTAKQYPRDIAGAIERAKQLVTMTPEVTQDCVYAKPQGGETITGASIRFAEIMLSVWGNARAITRVTHMDGEFIYATADFIDLELNNAIRIERRRRVLNKRGELFNTDMMQTTGNAASSFALRQAILQGIPSGYWQTVYDHANTAIMGDIKTLSANRQRVLQGLSKFGVTAELVCAHLQVASVDQITRKDITLLYGIGTSLKAGDLDAEQLAAESGYTIPTGKGAGVNPAKAQEAVVDAIKEVLAPAEESQKPSTEALKATAEGFQETIKPNGPVVDETGAVVDDGQRPPDDDPGPDLPEGFADGAERVEF